MQDSSCFVCTTQDIGLEHCKLWDQALLLANPCALSQKSFCSFEGFRRENTAHAAAARKHNRALHHLFDFWQKHEILNGNRACALPHKRYSRRIAAKRGYVLFHPLDRANHIVKSEILRALVGIVSEHVEPIIRRDANHALFCDFFAVERAFVARTYHERAAVNIQQNRQIFRIFGYKNIEI